MIRELAFKNQNNSKKDLIHEVSVSSVGIEQELFATKIRIL